MTASFSPPGLPQRLAFPSPDGSQRAGIDREKLDRIVMQATLAEADVRSALDLAREARDLADAAIVAATLRANRHGLSLFYAHGLAGVLALPPAELEAGQLSLVLLRQAQRERARCVELQSRATKLHLESGRLSRLVSACIAYAAERN